MASKIVSEDAWTVARDRLLTDPDLTMDEQDSLRSCAVANIITELLSLEAQHAQGSKARFYLRRLRDFLGPLTRFGPALDVLANADSHGLLSLVWGSMRIVLLIAKDFDEYFDQLLSFLCDIGAVFERLQRYQTLAPQSARLRRTLSRIFAEFLEFSHDTRNVFRKKKSSKHKALENFLSIACSKEVLTFYLHWLEVFDRTSLKVLRSKLWTDYNGEADKRVLNIKGLCDDAEREAHLAVAEQSFQRGKEATAFYRDVRDVTSKQEKRNGQDIAEGERRLMKQIGEWLAPVPVEVDYESFRRRLFPGTCEWIYEKAEFSRWLLNDDNNKNPSLLWISGIPGAGKTYLSTHIIQRLRKRSATGYFYCKANDERKRTVLAILRTWTWQLLQQNPSQLDKVTEIFYQGTPANIINMTEALTRLVHNIHDCRLVLDGLDECKPKDRRELFHLLPDLTAYAKILIVCQNERDISRGVETCDKQNGYIRLRMTESDNETDIRCYLREAIDQLDLKDKEMEERAFSTILEGANGMFLWVKLMIKELSLPGKTIEECEKALQRLPRGLDALYVRILDGINSNALLRTTSRQIFQWILGAQRPLTLKELDTALAIRIEQENFDPKRRIRDLASAISQCCGSLVDIDQGLVRFVHASVKEFLLNTAQDSEPTISFLFTEHEVNRHAAQCCLTYLSYSNIGFAPVDSNYEDSLTNLDKHIAYHDFLDYAALNWYVHLEWFSDELDDKTCSTLRRFYNSEHHSVKWLQLIHRLRVANEERQSVPSIVMFDKVRALSKVQQAPYQDEFSSWFTHLDLEPGGRFFRFQRYMHSYNAFDYLLPIHIAAFFDFVEVVRDELDNGVSVDARGSHPGGPLFSAVRGAAIETTKLLIERGASVSIRDGSGETVLMEAIDWEGNTESTLRSFDLAGVLIKAGVDVCAKSISGNTALKAACRIPSDDVYVIELLHLMLESGAKQDLDGAIDEVDQSPLHLVTLLNYPERAKILLQYGANPEGRPRGDFRDTRTPLMTACWNKDSTVVPVLLEAGANVNARDENGRTALHVSATRDSKSTEILLDHGADVNAVTTDRNALPLHCAVRGDHVEQMRLLLLRGSELEVKDARERTPLDIAVDNQSSRAVEILLKAGARAERDDTIIECKEMQLRVRHVQRIYWPSRPRDVFRVAIALHRRTGNRLPNTVISSILNLAEYWLKMSVARSDWLDVNEELSGPAYLETKPIIGCPKNPIKRIVFTTKSLDQGFSSYPDYHGTYEKSRTWFEPRITRANGLLVHPERSLPRIVTNVHAGREAFTHVVKCDRQNPREHRAWVRQLKPGDVVGVVPAARGPCWVNHVRSVQIDMYTTCLIEEPEIA